MYTIQKSLSLHGLVPIIRNRSGWIVGGTGCELLPCRARSSSLALSILGPRSWREVVVKFLGAKGGIIPLGGPPPGGRGKAPPKFPGPMPGGIALGGNGGAPGGIMGGKPGPGGNVGPTLWLLT